MPEVSLLRIPRQLVLFHVGETQYGLDIEAVNEILPILPITPTPGVPPGVLGLADVRKHVVPVFDLHVRFGAAPPESPSQARLILVQCSEGPVAMLVGSVDEVVTVSPEDFQPVATPGKSSDLGYLRGVLRRDDATLTLWVDHRRLVPTGIATVAAAA